MTTLVGFLALVGIFGVFYGAGWLFDMVTGSPKCGHGERLGIGFCLSFLTLFVAFISHLIGEVVLR